MPIYPYSFQLPPLNVQDIPNDGAPGEFLGINVGGQLDWLPAGGGGSGDMLAANNLSELTNFATARTNIGLGTASTPTFANLTLTSPSLSSSAPVTISQTWNAGSNVMTALKVVATDTASGATSNLLELWAGSTPALDFAVTKAGVMQAYGTYSSAGANYARLALACDSSGNATISTQALGTGTAGVLAFSPGNSERMRITTAGNVGIGTTAPSTKLEVALPATGNTLGQGIKISRGAGYFSVENGTSGDGYLGVITGKGSQLGAFALAFNGISGSDADTTNPVIAFSSRNTAGSGVIGNSQIAVQFNNYTTNLISVLGSGNVGIGTTAPGAKLQVVGNAIFGENLASPTINNVSFGGSYGTSTPGNKANLKWDMYNDGTNRYGIGMSTNLMEFQAGINGGFGFYPNNGTTSALHIINSGNVGIGTASPTSKLHVVGDAVLTGQLLGSNYTVGIADSVTQANIAITNNHVGFADSAIVITPKGTGAFILGPKPDGTTVGGAVRGLYAIDLQLIKTATTHVASGNYSVICGGGLNIGSGVYSAIGGGSENRATQNYSTVAGGNNCQATGLNSTIGGGLAITASGSYSFVGGGQSNTCSASYSFIAGGSAALANRYGLSAHAAGQFAAQGDAQSSRAVFRNKTTTNSAVELFLDGVSARYTVTSGKIISMLINITGTKSDGSAVAHYVRQYSIKNIGGTTSQVYAAVTVGTDNAAGTSIAISADDTNDSLKIEVTGVAAETWRWVASVDAVEVGHGV